MNTMNIEEAIALVDQILGSNRLSDLQEQVLRRVWVKEKYPDIAEALGYDANYIKDLGAKIWKQLSLELGEKVTKSNIQSVLRRHQPQRDPQSTEALASSPPAPPPKKYPINWEEKIDTTGFVGRTQPLETLMAWLKDSPSPLVAITGMAGLGKTTLAAKFIEEHHDFFDCVVWRSLRHPKRLPDLLIELNKGLPVTPEQSSPEISTQIELFLRQLRQRRCLIILDGVESLLNSHHALGDYHPQYDAYHDFFQRICTTQHESTILITCREEPKTWIHLQNTGHPARSIRLTPFSPKTVESLLSQRGPFLASAEDWIHLTEQYGGNPLALQIVSANILDFFLGNITEFLTEGQVVFKGLSAVLQQQWSTLPPYEQWVLYYLAVRREAVSFKEIKSDIQDISFQRRLTEILATLVRRSLIIAQDMTFYLQTAVSEYVTFHLIERVSEELIQSQFKLVGQFPLLKIKRQNYIQNTQRQVILQPILDQLKTKLSTDQKIFSHLQTLLARCKQTTPDYTAGNLTNLLLQIDLPLSNLDLSTLPLWEVNFAALSLTDVNLQDCDLSRTQFSHAFSGVISSAFSPNREQFATGHEDGMIFLWNSNGRQILRLKGHSSWVWDLCWTDDGQSLVSVSEDQSLRVWDTSTGHCKHHLTGHQDRIWQVVSPQPDIAISCSSDRTIKVWDLEDGRDLRSLSGHTGDIKALAIGENQQVFSAGLDQTIRRWDYQQGKLLETWKSSDGGIWAIAYDSRHQILFSGGDHGIISLWQTHHSSPVKSLHHQKHRIWSLALSPCKKYLMVGGEGNELVRWDLKAQQIDRIIPGYEGRIWSVNYNSVGDQVITASEDNTVQLWDIHRNQPLLKLSSYSNWVCDVTVVPTSQKSETSLMASAHEDGHLYLWHLHQKHPPTQLKGHQQSVWAIACNPSGNKLVSGSKDQTLRIWQIETGKCEAILRGHQRQIWSVAWSTDDQIIASGSGDRTVKLWEAETGDCITTFEGHQSRIWSVAISPTSQQIASGSGDRTIKLWDRATHHCIHTLTGHDSQVLSIAYNPAMHNILASVGGNGICKIWNLESQDCDTLTVPVKMLWSVAWSPNGERLAMGGDDGSIRVWNTQSKAWELSLSSQSGCIWAIAFGANGTQLCTSNQDGTLQVWDVVSGKNLQRLQPKRLYEGLNLMDTKGLTPAQIQNLERLGAKS